MRGGGREQGEFAAGPARWIGWLLVHLEIWVSIHTRPPAPAPAPPLLLPALPSSSLHP